MCRTSHGTNMILSSSEVRFIAFLADTGLKRAWARRRNSRKRTRRSPYGRFQILRPRHRGWAVVRPVFSPRLNFILNTSFPRRNEGVLSLTVPFLGPTLVPYSAYTWNYSTEPQKSLDGRKLVYPRGRVLGGSSSISESLDVFRSCA